MRGDLREMMTTSQSPFTAQMLADVFSNDFKMPSWEEYDGISNPVRLFDNFHTWIDI